MREQGEGLSPLPTEGGDWDLGELKKFSSRGHETKEHPEQENNQVDAILQVACELGQAKGHDYKATFGDEGAEILQLGGWGSPDQVASSIKYWKTGGANDSGLPNLYFQLSGKTKRVIVKEGTGDPLQDREAPKREATDTELDPLKHILQQLRDSNEPSLNQ